jgi:hypothetical protein
MSTTKQSRLNSRLEQRISLFSNPFRSHLVPPIPVFNGHRGLCLRPLRANVKINTLNAELNPICHLLALLQAHPILHVIRIRVKWSCNSTPHICLHCLHMNNSAFTLSLLHQITIQLSSSFKCGNPRNRSFMFYLSV